MSAYGNMDAAILGLMADIDHEIETLRAAEALNGGNPLFAYEGDDPDCYKAHQDVGNVILDADLITANVLTITLDGFSAVAVTFATDHLTTMNAMKAALEAAISGLSVTVGGTSNRTLTLAKKGYDFSASTLTGVVTLGSTQAGVTYSYTTNSVFMGVATVAQKSSKDTVGVYDANDPVNCCKRGKIWVYASKAVNSGTKAYIITAPGSTQGQFTDSSSGTYDCDCYFRGTISAAGMVQVEVRGIKNA